MQKRNEAKILIVEDETITAMEIENSLIGVGFQVVGLAASHDEAMTIVQDESPDLILMDIKLKGELDGIRTAEDIQNRHDIPIIYLTAYSDLQTLNRAKSTKPYSYIAKPFNDNDLHASIMITLNNYNIEKQTRENEYWLTSLLNSMDEAIIATDQTCRIQWMNTHAEVLIGYEACHMKGERIDQILHFIHTDSKDHILHPSSQILQSAIPVSIRENVSMITSKRPRIPIMVRGNPIIDINDCVIGSVLIIQMIREDDV